MYVKKTNEITLVDKHLQMKIKTLKNETSNLKKLDVSFDEVRRLIFSTKTSQFLFAYLHRFN